MKLLKTAHQLTTYLNNLQTDDHSVSIGFVPTMGALHEGHLSLIDRSVLENQITICSIFVNPTQFGEEKDLVTYPKPIERDMELLIAHRCDVLFLPEVEEIYPKGYDQVHFELNGLDLRIEGAQRPGHFQGVCNVLKRFFEIIQPNKAYFGQKDYQQTVVARKLVQLLQRPIAIVVVPIAREPHGLAMSSRNIRLSPSGRQKARFIQDALQDIQKNHEAIGLENAIANARKMMESQEGAELEYLVAVDADTLEEADSSTNKLVVVTVVKYEGVRLLDNILLN